MNEILITPQTTAGKSQVPDRFISNKKSLKKAKKIDLSILSLEKAVGVIVSRC